MSAFLNIQDELSVHGIDLHPSELHGMLVGYLCAVKDGSLPDQRAALYEQWLGGKVPGSLAELLESESRQVLDNLEEFADFDFRLLIPPDDSPISERAGAISLWCSGFLSGFGESGRAASVNPEGNVQEVLQDLGRVAGMTDDVPEGEDNETDLTEIEEFIRVSALLVFAEGTGGSTH
jgi:uncharacterized protein YgfB (UPF0149 family)